MKRAALAGVIVVVVLGAYLFTRLPEPRVIHRSETAASSKSVERGRLVYAKYGCALCHGEDGNSGITNPNSETKSKVPAVIFVQEGYSKPELRTYLMTGNQHVGKELADGPSPPYCMPGKLGMDRDAAGDLADYLFSLLPEENRKKLQEKW